MIQIHPSSTPTGSTGPLADAVRRDLEVGRYDHVPQGASWLRAIAEEAARVAGAPAAAVNLMKSGTQRTVAAVGTEVTYHARKDSMCGAIIDLGRTLHVRDVSADQRWAKNPFVDGRWARVRFYGAHPLISPSGLVVGTLCVFDDRPRELAPEQVADLDELASRVVAGLEQSRLAALEAGMSAWTTTVAFPQLLADPAGARRVEPG